MKSNQCVIHPAMFHHVVHIDPLFSSLFVLLYYAMMREVMYHSEGGICSATLLGAIHHGAFSHRFNDTLVPLILYNQVVFLQELW